MLLITVADDGRGIDPEIIRKAIVHKKLTTPRNQPEDDERGIAGIPFPARLHPKRSGFRNLRTGRRTGRGADYGARGRRSRSHLVRMRNSQGTRFQLELPLTLSVVRTLLGEIGGEPYAFPLARIEPVLKLSEGADRVGRRTAAFRAGSRTDRSGGGASGPGIERRPHW